MSLIRLENADDLIRIRQAANALGIDMISLYEAKELWDKISSSHFAQWLCVGSTENARQMILTWLEEQGA